MLKCGVLAVISALVLFGFTGTRQANSYEPMGGIWRVMPISYCVNPEGAPPGPNGPMLSDEAFIAAVRRAFQQWEELPDSNISFVYAGRCSSLPYAERDEVNTIGWARLQPDAGGVTLLYTRKRDDGFRDILEADIMVNSRDQRLLGGIDQYVYLNTVLPFVLVHEVGHFVGLDHVADQCAVMRPRSQITTLCPDDVAGAAFLYP
jgi:hypothetical protein